MSAAVSLPDVVLRSVKNRRRGPKRVWTEAEIAILRQHYAQSGTRACVALLPHRSATAVNQAATRYGVAGPAQYRRWTKDENILLRSLWGEATVEAIARKLGRPHDGVHQHAIAIGLDAGIPQGCESVKASAKRCGFSHHAMVRVLAFGGAKTSVVPTRLPGKRGRSYRHRYVDAFRADEAVACWLDAENVSEAAHRRKLVPNTLRLWLTKANVPGRPKRLWKHWRVPTETIDRVVAEHQRATR